MKKFLNLQEKLSVYSSLAIALSGGVDSAVLLSLALKALGKKRVLAIHVVSPIFTPEENKKAEEICQFLGLKLYKIPLKHLKQKNFLKNSPLRCYYCKSYMYKNLLKFSKRKGVHFLADGTHFDDLFSFRPGLKAIKELGILIPLAEMKILKKEIRDYAQQIGLPVAKKPAYSCLATKIFPGDPINQKKLSLVYKIEKLLYNEGLERVRIKIKNRNIYLYLEEETKLWLHKKEEIEKAIKKLDLLKIHILQK